MELTDEMWDEMNQSWYKEIRELFERKDEVKLAPVPEDMADLCEVLYG